jgi:hypothetical protein
MDVYDVIYLSVSFILGLMLCILGVAYGMLGHPLWPIARWPRALIAEPLRGAISLNLMGVSIMIVCVMDLAGISGFLSLMVRVLCTALLAAGFAVWIRAPRYRANDGGA